MPGHFDIDDSTGQILAKSELDYEGRKSYSVTVSVRDSKNVDGNPDAVTDDTIDITINVIGENEAPGDHRRHLDQLRRERHAASRELHRQRP